MQVTIDDPDRVRIIEVPASGQISVGKDLADKTVRVAVEIVEDE